MGPADQRLEADPAAVLGVADRLVVHLESAGGERFAEIALQLALLPGPAVRLRVVEREDAAPRGLGGIHRGVGMAEQGGGRRAVPRMQGHADAGADHHRRVAHVERPRHEVHHAARELARLLAAGAKPQDRELVAAETGQGVARAQRLAQAGHGIGQQLVARLVAVHVVDQLEAVEVNEHQRRQLAAGDGGVQPLAEGNAVRQPGQHVVAGQVIRLILHGAPLGHVRAGADGAAARQGVRAHLQDRPVRPKPLVDVVVIHLQPVRAARASGRTCDPGAVVQAEGAGTAGRDLAEHLPHPMVGDHDAPVRRGHQDALADVLHRPAQGLARLLHLAARLSQAKPPARDQPAGGQRHRRHGGAGREAAVVRLPVRLEHPHLVEADDDEQRTVRNPAERADPVETVESDSLDASLSGVAGQLQRFAAAQVGSNRGGEIRRAGANDPVQSDQGCRHSHGVAIPTRERDRVDGRDHHAAEAAIGVEDAPGELEGRQSRDAPHHRPADEQLVAVGVIEVDPDP